MSYVELEMTKQEYDEWLALQNNVDKCNYALCLYAAKELHVEPEDEDDNPPPEDKWGEYDYSPDKRDSWIAWALVSEVEFSSSELYIDDDYIGERTMRIYYCLPWAEESVFFVWVDLEEYVHPVIERYDLTNSISGFESAKRHVDTWAKENARVV